MLMFASPGLFVLACVSALLAAVIVWFIARGGGRGD